MSRTRFIPATIFCVALLCGSALAGSFVTFKPAEPARVGARPQYVSAGDLDNDGLDDLVVVSAMGRQVDAFLAAVDSPSHVRSTSTLEFGSHLQAPALGDLNRDGRLDVAVADSEAKVVWVLLGHGDGTFSEPYAVAVPNSVEPTAVAIGDFSDQGAPDLAVADPQLGRVFILRSAGGTTPCFVASGEFAVGTRITQIVAADLDGDERPDLAMLGGTGLRASAVAIALWKRADHGVPEFAAVRTYDIAGNAPAMLLADLDNNGRPDISILNRLTDRGVGDVSVLMNQGNGAFTALDPMPIFCPFFTYGAPCALRTFAAADFDADGRTDIVVALSDPRGVNMENPNDAMQLFVGHGDGRFAPAPFFAVQEQPVGMVAAAMTASGRADVAVVGEGRVRLQAFLNLDHPTPDSPNGYPCSADDQCRSEHCVDGFCCGSQCDAGAVCNVPGREGTCLVPPPAPVACTDQSACDDTRFCVQGWCCDEPCVGGRCNVENLLGICIPGVADGEPCPTNGQECASGFCGRNFVCCRESCEQGYCDPDGLCLALIPVNTPCGEDAQCESSVCDPFVGICCDRRCADSESCLNGICTAFGGRSSDVAALAAAPNATPCTVCDPQSSNGLCAGFVSDSGGCSLGNGAPRDNALVLLLGFLALALMRCCRQHGGSSGTAGGPPARRAERAD